MRKSCDKCTYWHSFGTTKEAEGQCHRFPARQSTWSNHWCGEFRDKLADKPVPVAPVVKTFTKKEG